MKRAFLGSVLALLLSACGTTGDITPPVITPPVDTPAATFSERTTAVHTLANCGVVLALPDQPAYTGTTDEKGYLAWLVRIALPDPGGRRNAQVDINCPGYFPLHASWVIPEDGNQDVTFGGTAALGNQPLLFPGPQPVPPPVKIRRGIVRAEGRVFADDDGQFNPLGNTFFWSVWGERNDPVRYDKNLTFLDNRSDYIRILAEVGGGSWADRTIDPAWPDYIQQLGAAIDRAYDKHGQRSEISILGGGTGHEREAVAGVLSVIPGREHKIFAVEIANEGNYSSDALRDELTRQVMAAYPWLLVSPYSTADVDAYTALLSAGVGNSITPHTDRTNNTSDGAWRQVRQVYDFKGFSVTCRNDEPPGPQSSVATQEEPIHLAMTRAMSIIMGCGAYTFHPGAGIRGGGQADLDRGRPANLWESPNIEAQYAALLAVGKIIPADAANWTKEGSHWAGNPILVDQFLDEAADHGVISLYAAHADNRFIVLPLGVKNFVNMTSKQAAVIEVFSPVTGELLQTVTASAGGVFTLNGPERGGLSGYILRGRLR